MLITLLKILFTPFKFCLHHLFSGSHRNNFVHTIKILFTLWKVWSQIKCKNHEYVVQNMQTSHQFALFTHGWYEKHTYLLKSSLCGVTQLCFGTKQVRLGVITSDECKNAPRTICPSLVRQHGMDGGVFSHTVHALVQLTWHHTVALQCCPHRWWGASSSQVYIQGVCESTLNSNLCTHGVPSKS